MVCKVGFVPSIVSFGKKLLDGNHASSYSEGAYFEGPKRLFKRDVSVVRPVEPKVIRRAAFTAVRGSQLG